MGYRLLALEGESSFLFNCLGLLANLLIAGDQTDAFSVLIARFIAKNVELSKFVSAFTPSSFYC